MGKTPTMPVRGLSYRPDRAEQKVHDERKTPELRRITPAFLAGRGYSSVESYLGAGNEVPSGTITKSIKSGGDYASASAWAGALTADSAEDQTGQYQQALNDTTACTIGVSNTVPCNITLTVQTGSGYVYREQTGWPNCAAVEGLAARLMAALTVATNNVIVELLEMKSASSNGTIEHTTGASICLVRYCMIRECSGFGVRSTTGTGHIVHNCFFYGNGKSAVATTGGTCTVYNCTVHKNREGFYEASGTLECYNCLALSSTTNGDYYGSVGGDYNLDSDGTAPGAHTWTATWQNVINNGNPGEEDLHLTTSREWANDLVVGSSLEDVAGKAWPVLGTGYSVVPGSLFGSYCLKVDYATVTSGSVAILAATDATTCYLSFFIDFNTLSMTDGDFHYIGRAQDTANLNLFNLRVRRSGANYQFAVYDAITAAVGSYNTLSSGRHWVKIYYNKGTGSSGTLTWWLDGVQKDTGTVDYSARSGLNCGANNLLWSYSVDVGTSGAILLDHFQLTTTDHGEPDDATSPYGDDATATYGTYGGSYGYTTDIDGETVTDGYLGADGAVAAAGGGNARLLDGLVEDGMLLGGRLVRC